MTKTDSVLEVIQGLDGEFVSSELAELAEVSLPTVSIALNKALGDGMIKVRKDVHDQRKKIYSRLEGYVAPTPDPVEAVEEPKVEVKPLNKTEATIQYIENLGGEFTVDDLADRLNLSRGPVDKACQILIKRGSLSFRKNGRQNIYFHGKMGVVHKVEDIIVEPTIIPVEKQMFMIEHLAGMVITGVAPSFLLTGMAGVGKTHDIRKALEAHGREQGEDYKWISGKASAMGLYRSLHDNRNNLSIFDDCDDVIKKPECGGILKSVLDLKRVRCVSWPSKTIADAGLEESFEFTGGIIFISNLPFTSIAGPLTSRAFKVDVFLTPDQVIEKIKMIIKDIEPNGSPMKMEYKEDALDCIIDIKDEVLSLGKPLDLRAYEKACLLRESAEEAGNWGQVKEMVKYQI